LNPRIFLLPGLALSNADQSRRIGKRRTSDEYVGDRARAVAKMRLDENVTRRAKKAEQRRLRPPAREDPQRQAPEPAPATIIGVDRSSVAIRPPFP